MTPEERRDAINRIVGYGDYLTARIAYIGLEEGSDRKKDSESDESLDERLERYVEADSSDGCFSGFVGSRRFQPDLQPDHSVSPTERIQCIFTMRMRELLNLPAGCCEGSFYWEEFGKEHEVVANLRPVGRSRTSSAYDGHTLSYYGVEGWSTDQILAYFSAPERREIRMRSLKKLMAAIGMNGGVVVVAGLRDNDESELLGLVSDQFPVERKDLSGTVFNGHTYARRRKLVLYRAKPIICLTQHPSGGWFNENVIEELATTLASLL